MNYWVFEEMETERWVKEFIDFIEGRTNRISNETQFRASTFMRNRADLLYEEYMKSYSKSGKISVRPRLVIEIHELYNIMMKLNQIYN